MSKNPVKLFAMLNAKTQRFAPAGSSVSDPLDRLDAITAAHACAGLPKHQYALALTVWNGEAKEAALASAGLVNVLRVRYGWRDVKFHHVLALSQLAVFELVMQHQRCPLCHGREIDGVACLFLQGGQTQTCPLCNGAGVATLTDEMRMEASGFSEREWVVLFPFYQEAYDTAHTWLNMVYSHVRRRLRGDNPNTP